jgi:hypothetical protein
VNVVGEEAGMRTGAMWRFAVLAAVALLASGQLCMLTTCVPRLQKASAAEAHSCCHAVAETDAPSAPIPMGAMPCDQSVSLAGVPTLDAPAPAVLPLAIAADAAVALMEIASIELAPIERDTGPSPGRHTPAPTGLRAPPRA